MSRPGRTDVATVAALDDRVLEGLARDRRPAARAHLDAPRASTAPAPPRCSGCTAGRSTCRRWSCSRRRPRRSSQIIQLANRERIPVVPRAGGTGLVDGAVPLHHGILVDIKRMDRVFEIDLAERTVTVGAGRQHAEAQRAAAPARRHVPGQPGVVLVRAGGRPDRHERLVAARLALRPRAPARDLVRDRAADRRDHPRRRGRRRKDAVELVGLPPEGAVHGRARARSASSRRRRSSWSKRPEAEFSAFWMQRSFDAAWRTGGDLMRSGFATIAGVMLFDERKVAYLRRDDEAYIPQPDWATAVVAFALYGNKAEVRAGGQGDDAHREGVAAASTWATRSRSSTGRRGTTATRRRCTDARRTARWRRCRGTARTRRSRIRRCRRSASAGMPSSTAWSSGTRCSTTGGCSATPTGRTSRGATCLCEIDVGIWEQELDDETWGAWVDAKRDIAARLAGGGRVDLGRPRLGPRR